jgi:hypothetical protein
LFGKFFSLLIKTLVFCIFVGWLVSKFDPLTGDGSLFDAARPSQGEETTAGGGLIVPSNDPRFVNN